MNRVIVYPGQVPLEADILDTNKEAMVAIARLAGAVFGNYALSHGLEVRRYGWDGANPTGETDVYPTKPNALSVDIGTGTLFCNKLVDETSYSTSGTDSRTVLKQAHNTSAVTFPLASYRPLGGEVKYINIAARISESDTGGAVLPYYNSDYPHSALGGSSQARRRGLNISFEVVHGLVTTVGSEPIDPVHPDFGVNLVPLCKIKLHSTTTCIFSIAGVSDTTQRSSIYGVEKSYRTTEFLGRLYQQFAREDVDLSGVALLAASNAFVATNSFLAINSVGNVMVGGKVASIGNAHAVNDHPRLQQFKGAFLSGFRIPQGSTSLNAQASANGFDIRFKQVDFVGGSYGARIDYDMAYIGRPLAIIATPAYPGEAQAGVQLQCWLSNIGESSAILHGNASLTAQVMIVGLVAGDT